MAKEVQPTNGWKEERLLGHHQVKNCVERNTKRQLRNEVEDQTFNTDHRAFQDSWWVE